ncbi:hypothetical protein PHMEG_00020490 [Phytophthora megakarya]|uniref:Uncharacterized protein n=1 Tax=Phytophthora megakarya TaxID=4795 RepID=A0A225VP89_9STRA|nr:hypothetical protein PHMEG_00020490 [Phytophthora megakarya]
MTKGRVSRAVARLLRPFHRHSKIAEDSPTKRQHGSVTSTNTSSTCSTVSSSSRHSIGFRGAAGARVFTIKSDSDGIPHTVRTPPSFFRQLRTLVEQTEALTTGEQYRASHKGPDQPHSSSRGIRWRGDFSTKTLEKLTSILTDEDSDGFGTIGRRSSKPVPLETATKAMLQLWQCCMQILDVLADGAAPEPSLRHTMAHSRDVAIAAANEKKHQLEQAALTLLALVIRRQEFDALLVAAGQGGCKSHKPTEDARHGKGRLGSNTEFNPFDQHQELLSALVATSYMRVPRLRSHMLGSLNNLLATSAFTRSNSLSFSMYPQCQNLLTTMNREDRWKPTALMLNQLMIDMDGSMLVLAQIFEQLTGQQVLGRTDWKCIPGGDVLKDATLEVTKCLFQTELQQREPKWQDTVEEKISSETASANEPQPFREPFSLLDGDMEESNTPTAYFAVQLTSMMHENVGFLHQYIVMILRSTNYMLPHHVALCLQYMEKLMLEFPSFFANESAAQNFLVLSTMDTSNPHNEPQQEHSCADVETMRYVFSCLLDSEHFEILKATELFLLKNFMGLSVSLQLQLTDVLAIHVKRLFLHWNRDVRYCYYHILLYLTYPGNRLVLGAKSDEALMGTEASRLFEIPGLVRTASTANWDAFDIPLHQIVTHYSQTTKRRALRQASPSWVDAVPWLVVQRSVTEYKTHVKTYFANAQQISMHQRVSTPVFVKTGENACSPASAESPRAAAILA